MTDLSLDQIKENEAKIREELEEAEHLEESAFVDARGTEELLEKLYNAGLPESKIKRIVENEESRLIEEERSEVAREGKGVEIEEDAILREKQNLGVLAEKIHMVFNEEEGVMDEFQNLKNEVDSRPRPYDSDFKEAIILNSRRIVDMLVTEAMQEKAITSIEDNVLEEIAFMVSQTEFDEDLDGLQMKEERGTASLGRKYSDKALLEVGQKLYEEVHQNYERSKKEAEQEANEASKIHEEIITTLKESRRTEEQAETFVNFVDFLVEEVEGEEFSEAMKQVREKAKEAYEIARQDEEVESELEQKARAVGKEAKKAAK